MPLFPKLSSKIQKSSAEKVRSSTPKENENGSFSVMENAKNKTEEIDLQIKSIDDNEGGEESKKFASPPPPTNFKSTSSSNGRKISTENRSQESLSSPRTSFRSPTPPPPPDSVKTIKGGNPMLNVPPPALQDSKLVFHCQLAHGSPTGLLCGFTNSRELYERAAECYEIPVDDILYCTLNTHKIDMDHLLGGQIGLDDFIFVHVKGQKKEVDFVKEEGALGVTITDNGAGKAFIKRIKSDSVVGRLGDVVRPGDHIEAINGESMITKKHYDVAKYMRDLPIGATLTLRLIEPTKAGFSVPSSRTSVMSSSSFSKAMFMSANANGMQTLRFKAKGTKTPVVVDAAPNSVVIDRINALLESYLGIHDSELAMTIWDMAKEPGNANNPVTFLSAMKKSELSEFQIPDEVVFDLWAATRDNRLLAARRTPATAIAFNNADGEDDKTLTRQSTSASKNGIHT